MLKNLVFLGIIVVFLIALFLRFYNLGAIPLGLNKDETAIGYNAYAITQTGKDEHNVSYPLYFKSFNDFKLPVYIYLTAASENIFGVTPFAVRFPSALFGCITIVSLFFLVKILSKKIELAVLTAIFLAFNPWQFFFSRTGFEVNVAVSLVVLGSLFFVLSIQKKGNIFLLILSILTFGLSLYSYNVARIFSPLLLLALTAIYHKQIFAYSKKYKIVGGIFVIIILLPLLLVTTKSYGNVDQTAGIFLNGALTKAQTTEFRSYLFNTSDLYSKVFFNSYILIFWEYCRNIVRSFSTDFFFILGPKSVNGIANHGLFYPFELITIIVGLYAGWKNKEKYLRYFFLWLLMEIGVIALTQEVPHPTRSFMQVIPLSVFSAYGGISIWNWMRKLHSFHFRYLLQFSAIFVVCYAFLTYFTMYFFVFPANQAKVWRATESELSIYLDQNESNYDKIIIDPKTDFSYTALAYYTKYSPKKYQETVKYKKDGLLLTVAELGKYKFEQIDWNKYASSKKTLYITTSDGFKDKPVLKTFYYPERHIVSTVDQKIISYPFNESSYVLIKSNK